MWSCAACGSGERDITQPSPQPVLVHHTLNPSDNRSSRKIVLSYEHANRMGIPFRYTLAFDDFTSAVTTTIRTVSWQGGYCSGGPPPTAESSSFQLVSTA